MAESRLTQKLRQVPLRTAVHALLGMTLIFNGLSVVFLSVAIARINGMEPGSSFTKKNGRVVTAEELKAGNLPRLVFVILSAISLVLCSTGLFASVKNRVQMFRAFAAVELLSLGGDIAYLAISKFRIVYVLLLLTHVGFVATYLARSQQMVIEKRDRNTERATGSAGGIGAMGGGGNYAGHAQSKAMDQSNL